MTPARSTRLPVALAGDLRRRIAAGIYVPGQRLPSEPELAAELAVSRASLREALGLLVNDGWVVRRHGSGTYVAERNVVPNSIETNFGVSALIRTAGRRPGTSVSTHRTVTADADIAAALGVEIGAAVEMLTRVRTADDEPVVHSVDHVRAGLLAERALANPAASLYDLLAAAGHPVVRGIAHLRAVVAGAALARDLGVARGSALMRIEQVDTDAGGVALVFSVEHHRSDVFDVVVRRSGPADG